MSRTQYNNHIRLNELTAQACDVLEDIFDELGLEYRLSSSRIFGPCPIHGGDNQGALCMYPKGEEIGGIWMCHTHHCERTWKKTLIGFIHGVLSTQKATEVQWTDAVDWLCDFLGYTSFNDIVTPDAQELSRRRYSGIHNKIRLLPRQSKSQWTRYDLRQKLIIPSEYYLNRGYSPEILDKYDVGWYSKVRRVVVPIYDDDYRYITGFTGRTTHDQCGKCQQWHSVNDPCSQAKYYEHAKWIHSKEFEASQYLYNYWFAREHIQDSLTVILVEGPGDVWKLEEAGIHNAVAMFGVDLTDAQKFILEQSGAMSAIIMLDNDEAGMNGAVALKQQLGRFLRLFFPTFHGSDVGELQTDTVTTDIQPIINNITKAYK